MNWIINHEKELQHMMRVLGPAMRAIPGWKNMPQSGCYVANGSTGFFGKWLIASVHYLNAYENKNIQLKVITHDVSRLLTEANWVSQCQGVEFIEKTSGWERKIIDCAPVGLFHMSASSDAEKNAKSYAQTLKQMIDETYEWGEFIKIWQTTKWLYVSSGAVYGKRLTPSLENDDACGPALSGVDAVYGHAKRACEVAVQAVAHEHQIPWVITRPFAFGGGYLPLDKHFAWGNFLNQAHKGQDIVINGNGKPVRSYLHIAEAIAWHWEAMISQNQAVLNVGSMEVFSLKDLALTMLECARSKSRVTILKPDSPDADFYIPDVRRAENLGLKQIMTIKDMINDSLQWLGDKQ